MLRVARAKARAIVDWVGKTGRIVLAADTTVVVSGEMLGKPRDTDDAARMLHSLFWSVSRGFDGCCLRRRDTRNSGRSCGRAPLSRSATCVQMDDGRAGLRRLDRGSCDLLRRDRQIVRHAGRVDRARPAQLMITLPAMCSSRMLWSAQCAPGRRGGPEARDAGSPRGRGRGAGEGVHGRERNPCRARDFTKLDSGHDAGQAGCRRSTRRDAVSAARPD